MIVVVITHMQEQFLSYFTVSHADLFVGLFCFPIFPVLAGLMELETTSVAAHKPAVPLVSLPYIFLLSTTSFSLCLSPSLQQQWTHTWVSVFIACCLLFEPLLQHSTSYQSATSKPPLLGGWGGWDSTAEAQLCRGRKPGWRGTTSKWNICKDSFLGWMQQWVVAHNEVHALYGISGQTLRRWNTRRWGG